MFSSRLRSFIKLKLHKEKHTVLHSYPAQPGYMIGIQRIRRDYFKSKNKEERWMNLEPDTQ